MNHIFRIAIIPFLVLLAACDNDSKRRIADPVPTAVTITTGQVGSPEGPISLSVSSGGEAPFNWTVSAGALPDGLALSAAGELSGTPTTPGAFTFTITVTDVGGRSGSVDGAIDIIEAAPVIAALTTTQGELGVTVNESLSIASGGRAPFTWSVSTGELPPGLTLSAAGALTGSPSTTGNYTFTIVVTDDNGETGSVDGAIAVIEAAPTIETQTLTNGRQDEVYSGTRLVALDGTLPLSWSATGLPPGLALNDEFISGTPTTYQPEPYVVTLTVTDARGRTDTAEVNLTVDIPEYAISRNERDRDGDGIWDSTAIHTFSNLTGLLMSVEYVDNYRYEFTYDSNGFLIRRIQVSASGALMSTRDIINTPTGLAATVREDTNGDGSVNRTSRYGYSVDGDLALVIEDEDITDGVDDYQEVYFYHLPTHLQSFGRDQGADGYEFSRVWTYPDPNSNRESLVTTYADTTVTQLVDVTWTDNPDGTVTRTAARDLDADGSIDDYEEQTIIRAGLSGPERIRLMTEVALDRGNDGFVDARTERSFTELDQLQMQRRDLEGDGIWNVTVTKTFNTDDNVERVETEVDGNIVQVQRITYENWYLGREPRFEEDAFIITE